ncbi:MAG: type 4a pilus biogenesis protein PilO [Desulfobulbaceae bacterium]|nr:type 4a pilus biogenesis protein PilO [Desulfobulbaceae bacterium]
MHPMIEKMKVAYWNFLDNKLAKMKQEHKYAICAGCVIGLSALFLFPFYIPKNKEIKKLNKENSYLKSEISKVEAIANKLDEHKAERAAVELQLKAAAMLLPKQQEIPSLLTNISEQGTNSGLEFVSFQPKPESKQEFYAIIPVTISVFGTYHKIGLFLDRLSKLNRIVSVNNITLSNPQVLGKEAMLTANLELVTYRFLSAAEQEPVAPKPTAASGKKRK